MQVSPHVRAVQIPTDNPMNPQFTTIYLVGDGQSMTIDSGEALEKYRWMLRGYLAAVERSEVAIAAITHHHADHSGNLKWVREVYGADVAIPPNARTLLRGKLPAKGVSRLEDDQIVDLGAGARVRVLVTPGHSVDSICFYLEEDGVLFTGDTLLGSTTTTVNDLGPYRRTLAKLLELPNLKVICPGHGPLVHDPRERLQSYVDHRNLRERQILGVLARGGTPTSWEIMLELYPEIDKRLRAAADGNVRTHLRQLEEEGRITTFAGRPRRPNAARIHRDIEHAKIREQTIARAEKLKAEKSRAIVRAQENPPTAQWIEPPRYALA